MCICAVGLVAISCDVYLYMYICRMHGCICVSVYPFIYLISRSNPSNLLIDLPNLSNHSIYLSVCLYVRIYIYINKHTYCHVLQRIVLSEKERDLLVLGA